MAHADKPIGNPLGETLASPSSYAPEVLFPIARDPARKVIGLSGQLAMHGFDHWQAFELSWLDKNGKPCVSVAELYFDCNSPSIVESKSLKLYLNSFNHERIQSIDLLRATIQSDLETASGSTVEVIVHSLSDYRLLMAKNFAPSVGRGALRVDLDQFPLIDQAVPLDASILKVSRLVKQQGQDDTAVEKRYVSDLFRSNCPVTNQPDWGSVFIDYKGPKIHHESLLKYVVSFREHTDFHEQCVERIFIDIMRQCKPESLIVYARYVRRGGLDINPYRSTVPLVLGNDRLTRQ